MYLPNSYQQFSSTLMSDLDPGRFFEKRGFQDLYQEFNQSSSQQLIDAYNQYAQNELSLHNENQNINNNNNKNNISNYYSQHYEKSKKQYQNNSQHTNIQQDQCWNLTQSSPEKADSLGSASKMSTCSGSSSQKINSLSNSQQSLPNFQVFQQQNNNISLHLSAPKKKKKVIKLKPFFDNLMNQPFDGELEMFRKMMGMEEISLDHFQEQ